MLFASGLQMCPQWSALDLGRGLFSISALKACGILLRVRSTHLVGEPMCLYTTLWDHSSNLCCSPWLSGAYVSGLWGWEFSLPSLPQASHDGVYISGTSRQMTDIYFRSNRNFFKVFRITNPLVRGRESLSSEFWAPAWYLGIEQERREKRKRETPPHYIWALALVFLVTRQNSIRILSSAGVHRVSGSFWVQAEQYQKRKAMMV